MGRVAVMWPDAQLWAVTYLRAALAAREEPYAASVAVGTKVPKDGALPHVMIRHYGGDVQRVADGTALLRVTVWHTSEARAQSLSQLAHALLLGHPGDESVRICQSLGTPFPADDPDNGNPIASFTVAARMRPIQI